jgi:hypothetical protein
VKRGGGGGGGVLTLLLSWKLEDCVLGFFRAFIHVETGLAYCAGKVYFQMACRLKDLKDKAPEELKAYYSCMDYYR